VRSSQEGFKFSWERADQTAATVDAQQDALERITQPISADAARAILDGRTEKPGGVNPSKWIELGNDRGQTYRIGDVPLDHFKPD
jgi:hypothetical protein